MLLRYIHLFNNFILLSRFVIHIFANNSHIHSGIKLCNSVTPSHIIMLLPYPNRYCFNYYYFLSISMYIIQSLLPLLRRRQKRCCTVDLIGDRRFDELFIVNHYKIVKVSNLFVINFIMIKFEIYFDKKVT